MWFQNWRKVSYEASQYQPDCVQGQQDLNENPNSLFLIQSQSSCLCEIEYEEGPKLMQHQEVNYQNNEFNGLVYKTCPSVLDTFVLRNEVEPIVYFDKNDA